MVPVKSLVPDLVIALTIMPLERPCVASNRLATTANSAIESRLHCGCSLSPAEW
jgi:hypothetical protein